MAVVAVTVKARGALGSDVNLKFEQIRSGVFGLQVKQHNIT